MENNNWYHKYYIKNIYDEDKYNKFNKYFNNRKKNNLKEKIENIEKNYKIKISQLKINYQNKNYIDSIKNLTSLELLKIEQNIIKILSKYCLENNILEFKFFTETIKLFKKICDLLKNRLNQPTIFHNDLDDGIPRCSYKFCNFKSSCNYNYNSKKNIICYQDHYVHNMISADIDILLKYINKKYSNTDQIIHNKEILKSINTLCYVINHMVTELNEKCLYLDKSEWDKQHTTKKVITKIIKAK